MNGQILFIEPPACSANFITGPSVREMLQRVNHSWLSSYVYLTFNNVIYIKIK